MRLIVQSLASGRFLAPGLDGQPDWCLSLRDASGGITDDPERVEQLIEDYADVDDCPVVVDLDVLGTELDT